MLIFYLHCSSSAADPEDGTLTFGGTLLQWQKSMHGSATEETWRSCSPGRNPCPAKVSGFCWHCPHKRRKGQKARQTTVLSRSNANPSAEELAEVPPDVRKVSLDHFPTWETHFVDCELQNE